MPAIAELVELEIPARVRATRIALGFSQSQFATRLQVASRTVKGWEHPDLPRGAPSFEHAARIAKLAGGFYPPELFMEDKPMETGVALRIERKLDLILEHLRIEDR